MDGNQNLTQPIITLPTLFLTRISIPFFSLSVGHLKNPYNVFQLLLGVFYVISVRVQSAKQ